jgi:hypothetical protein
MLRRILMVVALVSLGSTAALAGPFYVGASAMKTNLNIDDAGASFDASDTTYKAFVGFRFLKFLGLEASYIDFGTLDDSTSGIDLSVDATGYDLFLVGVLPIGKHFELFAKAGYFSWDRNADASGVVSGSDSESGSDPVYGAGLAFILGKHIGIRVEYEKYDMTDVDTLDQESAGIDFRF